jgi:hypothetical protein
MPADLDLAFAETVEAVEFDWPESLTVERTQMGIAEMVVAILVFTGFVVLARETISVVLRCCVFEVGFGHIDRREAPRRETAASLRCPRESQRLFRTG